MFSIITERRVVKNMFPVADPHPYRIAIIGEAPGEHEENHGCPFVGPSGQLLDSILRDVGIERKRIFIGNICQVRPPGNEISRFDWNGEEIQNGLKQLTDDLDKFAPHCCVLLGGSALRGARGSSSKITEWRGSLFLGTVAPFLNRKCIGSLHPASVLREFSGFPLLKFDLHRARHEGTTPVLTLPFRNLIVDNPVQQTLDILNNWPAHQRCSLDIEGGLNHWPCVSICADPTLSVTIAWNKYEPNDRFNILRAFARLMYREDVPKVLQNQLYDNFVLSYGYGIPIRNVVDDTMLKGWEIYCELPKGLGTQCSIWTREPFYKAERKSTDEDTYYRYCAKDSAVTLEICRAQDSALSPTSMAHYRKNVEMLNPLLYMELRGIKYDQEQVDKKLNETKQEIQVVGEALNAIAKTELRGEKGSLSAKRLQKALYETLGYPPQYKKEGGRKTDKLTSDVEALLHLRRKLPGDAFLNAVLRHRHLEGILETLQIRPDEDGRVRCGYNVVGTETGRLTCYTSPTGAGANLQTITKSLRSNYVADPDYDFFQCDLSGADGWTVAAHSARLGDPTMLNDYYAGLKPAKIIAFIYAFGPTIVQQMTTEDLLFWSGKKEFAAFSATFGKWLYDGCKVVQHGSNYLMGIPTMQTNLMKRSYKETGTPIYMEHSDGRVLQDGMFFRYPGVKRWHAWGEAQLRASGTLTSASGQTRVFFGRRFGKDIHETVKEFLAHEPQSNTTWATNLAMLRLWNDPDNRNPDGSLIIEPLHQVHDALCGQWPQRHRDWARRKVREYFDNSLTIAGTRITIPFDGGYGPSWGDCNNPI